MKAVIFDMDGTLFDTERLAVEAFDYAGEKIGIGKAGYITKRILGLTIEAARPVWRAEFGDGYREAELMYYKNEFTDRYFEKNGVPEKRGVREILEYLKGAGYKLGVASSTGEERVKKLLALSGIMGSFDDVVCGNMAENSKPAPDIFLLAAERIGALPKECIAVEDGKNGVLSAGRAGYGEIIMVPDLILPDEETKNVLTFEAESLLEACDYIKNKYGNASVT